MPEATSSYGTIKNKHQNMTCIQVHGGSEKIARQQQLTAKKERNFNSEWLRQ